MDDNTRKTLELFVEKAGKLAKYVSEMAFYGGLMGVFRHSEEDEWQIHPAIEGFILTFRMFIHKRDGIALYRVNIHGQPVRPELLDLQGMSESWHGRVNRAYKWIADALVITPENLKVYNESLTRWKILETFVYGEYAHAEPTHNETINQWRRDPDLFGKLRFEFVSVLQFMFGQILEVAAASKHELDLHMTGQNNIN